MKSAVGVTCRTALTLGSKLKRAPDSALHGCDLAAGSGSSWLGWVFIWCRRIRARSTAAGEGSPKRSFKAFDFGLPETCIHALPSSDARYLYMDERCC